MTVRPAVQIAARVTQHGASGRSQAWPLLGVSSREGLVEAGSCKLTSGGRLGPVKGSRARRRTSAPRRPVGARR